MEDFRKRRDVVVRIKGIINRVISLKNTRSYGYYERGKHVRDPTWDTDRIETAPYRGTKTEGTRRTSSAIETHSLRVCGPDRERELTQLVTFSSQSSVVRIGPNFSKSSCNSDFFFSIIAILKFTVVSCHNLP